MDEKTIEEAIGSLSILASRQGPASRFSRLDDDCAFCVLGAAAFIGRFGGMGSLEAQRFLSRLVGAGLRTESDLGSWISESFSQVSARRWDSSRKRAQEFLSAGIKVFVRVAPFPGMAARRVMAGDEVPECPEIVFGKGCELEMPPLLAVFNSRKPRLDSADATWLHVMRCFLEGLDHRQIGLVGSTGTLTYDLATVLAHRQGLLKIIVVSSPVITAERRLREILGEEARGIPVISCLLDGAGCAAKEAMRRRDRLVASLADFHLVLEIRSCGNLLGVLEKMQAESPRPQFILKPESPGRRTAGNWVLLRKFPEHGVGFKWEGRREAAQSGAVLAGDGFQSSKGVFRQLDLVPGADAPWRDYLFHYTRGCNGPWPGETYRRYLLEMLEVRALSGRSALEALVRIAREGLLRASCRMVRGGSAVVCWSSVPPVEVSIIRKWRRGLARWTLEPYGVAVRRDILRLLGAKPAVYGSGQIYARLPESEKFRFQASGCDCSSGWRHEREWRSSGDLALGGIRPGQGFFFVQTAEEAEKLNGCARPRLPVIAIEEREC